MEKDTITFELEENVENLVAGPAESPDNPPGSEIPTTTPVSEKEAPGNDAAEKDKADKATYPADAAENPADAEILQMMKEMGSEKLLEIIRGNRNAAIDRILEELRMPPGSLVFPSGNSICSTGNSIFDLAAQA